MLHEKDNDTTVGLNTADGLENSIIQETAENSVTVDNTPSLGSTDNQGFASFNKETGFASFESNSGFAAFNEGFSETNPVKSQGFGDFQESNGFADFKTADDGFDDFKTSTNNDDFGDFGDFEEPASFGDFEEPKSTVEPVFPLIEKNVKETERIKAILPHETDPFLIKLNQDIENAFVLSKQLESKPLPPKLYEQQELIEPLVNDNWTAIFKKLQTENIYNDPDIFRWRKSTIRTKFLDSISQTTTKAERIAQQQEEPKITDALADFREVELQNAKKLCDISEGNQI
ncbi:hypothetical protein HK103_005754 [Boothiomyces macroporosus]|uniref:Uncharacterized protein n=1 Tax=Boothiomyces macroporosus TaxID=261099 RepID=A0AAD5UES3_9FUNG|nr:hypothetical protein HK103_005754 [Boothiomyces macroporosus]